MQLISIHSFVQKCLFIGTVSQVSHVAHGPLVLINKNPDIDIIYI